MTTETPLLRGIVASQLDLISRARKFGVALHLGTDAPMPDCFFGASIYWELARFVEAGVPPIEAIRMATQDAADTLDADDLGRLEPGKAADLVLLDRNPLDDIANTRSIWRVVKDGWLFDPDQLRVNVHTDH